MFTNYLSYWNEKWKLTCPKNKYKWLNQSKIKHTPLSYYSKLALIFLNVLVRFAKKIKNQIETKNPGNTGWHSQATWLVRRPQERYKYNPPKKKNRYPHPTPPQKHPRTWHQPIGGLRSDIWLDFLIMYTWHYPVGR
jgi:hypothetical protein